MACDHMISKKEFQRLYVSAALLVAPAVFAATGERIGGAGFDAAEGETYDDRLASSVRDLVAYGVSRPDFDEGGSINAKSWASSVALKFQKIQIAKIEQLYNMMHEEDRRRCRARLKSCSGVGASGWLRCLLVQKQRSLMTNFGFVRVSDLVHKQIP